MAGTPLAVLTLTLALASPGEAYYVRATNAVPTPSVRDPWRDFEAWRARLERELASGLSIPPRSFDELFNDDFFRQSADPFADISAFERWMAPRLEGGERRLFEDSWRGWTFKRLDLSDVNPTTETTRDQVIVTFRMPKETAASLKVDVDARSLRFSYSKTTVVERKDAEGRTRPRTESVERYEKVMPVPAGADASQAVIRRGLDAVEVVFPRLAR